MDYGTASLKMHQKYKGKLGIQVKVPLKTRTDLSIAYTPGVAKPCLEIAKNKELAFTYTIKQNSVAVVTDGSAVLGLGNIGGLAGLPVMEGKAILFKSLANVDAYPICLDTQNTDEIVSIVRAIAPTFGGINLEDIASPQCVEIEQRLQDLGIPVMHDDQHGTAVVVMAGLINASKVTKQKMSDLTVVINGAGAAGLAIAKLLTGVHLQQKNPALLVKEVILVDSKGIISKDRSDLNAEKMNALNYSNSRNLNGSLDDALKVANVFVGVSKGNLLNAEKVKMMKKNPIIFALANPDPEILPPEAKKGGAAIIATGRSDYPNQVNNALCFPGIFRGALDAKAVRITDEMKIAAAVAIAGLIKKPTAQQILPGVLDPRVVKKVSKAVREKAIQQKVVRMTK